MAHQLHDLRLQLEAARQYGVAMEERLLELQATNDGLIERHQIELTSATERFERAEATLAALGCSAGAPKVQVRRGTRNRRNRVLS